MTRRDCVLSLAGGLCLSLVPACSHTASQVAAEPLALPLKSAGETGSQKPVTAAASPDGSLPGNAGDTNSRLKDSQIEQVRYPVRSTNREFVPEPPRLSEVAAQSPRPLPADSGQRPAQAETKAKAVPEPEVLSAMRYYLNKRPAQALVCLDHFDQPTHELLLCLLPLVARLGEGNLQQADRREFDAVLVQLQSVAAMLRLRADLIIDKMCFCSQIKEFGKYQPLEENHPFLPGAPVELYVQVQNFSCEQVGQRYRVPLSCRVEIRDYKDRLVWGYAFDDKPDLDRSPRSDFGNRYAFSIPSNMPRGDYTLWLFVTDVPTRRTARRSLDFRVVDTRSW